MGQILQADKIGILSHSAGSITLAASVLTIGGQQYITGPLTRAITADVSFVMNQRYQIYAIQTAGVVSLKFSSNENSVGPSGSTSWKLVGSFYCNGESATVFGSFINIDSVPQTDWIRFDPITVNIPYAALNCQWKRQGGGLYLRYFFALASPLGGTAYFDLPFSTIDGSRLDLTGNDGHYGSATANPNASQNYQGHLQIQSSNRFRVVADGGANEWGTSIPFSWAGSHRFSVASFHIPIVGLTETPIKDL